MRTIADDVIEACSSPTGGARGVLNVPDHHTVGTLEVLEHTAERLRAASRRPDLTPSDAKRLAKLGEELSSHALAARVLVTSGASSTTLRWVLERAVALLDDVHNRGAGTTS